MWALLVATQFNRIVALGSIVGLSDGLLSSDTLSFESSKFKFIANFQSKASHNGSYITFQMISSQQIHIFYEKPCNGRSARFCCVNLMIFGTFFSKKKNTVFNSKPF